MRQIILGGCLALVASSAGAQLGGPITGGDGTVPVFDIKSQLCRVHGGHIPRSVWETPALPAPVIPDACETPLCGGASGPSCDIPAGERSPGPLGRALSSFLGRFGQCARPTLNQCEDPAFMTRCGDAAVAGCATHASQMRARYRARWLATARGEVQVGHQSGALGREDLFAGDQLSVSALDPERLRGVFSVDPSSYRSQVNLLEYWSRNGGGLLTLIRLGQMRGLPVHDCFEYVHERFYDVSQLEIITLASTPRETFDYAYSQGRAFAADGTRTADGLAFEQLCASEDLRSLDDRDVFGRMFPHPIVQNAFHVMFLAEAALDGGEGDTQGLPVELVEFVRDHVPRDGEMVQPNWLWHALQSREMRTMYRRSPASIRPTVDYPCGATRTYGYTDEELNYLYDLQQRYQYLLSQLRVNTLRPDLVPENLPNDWIGDAINPVPEQSVAGIQRNLRLEAGASSVGGSGLGDLFDPHRFIDRLNPSVVAAIFAQDQTLASEILEVLEEAQEWGCLESDGPTPCDWSPKLFAELVQNRFKAEQEAAFDECEEYVTSAVDFSRERPVPEDTTDLVYDSGSPEDARFATLLRISCSARDLDDDLGVCPSNPEEGDTFNYSGNHIWIDGSYATTATNIRAPDGNPRQTFISRSRDHVASSTRGLILKAAGELLDEAPELLDTATSTLRLPTYAQTFGETLGNTFFEVEYGYGYSAKVDGFDSGTSEEEDLCHDDNALSFVATMDAHADVTILGHRVDDLVKATAVAVASDKDSERGVEAAVSVAGMDVYTSGGSRVNAVDDGGSRDFGRSIPGFDAWFNVLGVPIHVEAGATVVAGVDAVASTGWSCGGGDTTPEARLLLTVTPSLEAQGYASAAVDIGIARAGIKGTLTLIGIGLPIAFDMKILRGAIVIENGVDLQLSTLQGRLALFAEVGAGPFSLDAEKTLVSWGGVTRTEQLLHLTRRLPIDLMTQIPWGRRIVE